MVELLPLLLLSALAGAVAGVLGGMLGLGGGLVIIPALVWIFTAQGFATESLMQMALATSLASILFTGASSVHAHHRRDAVRWDLVRRLAPALMVGALAGSYVAEQIGSAGLMRLFGIFAAVMGIRMMWRATMRPPQPGPERAPGAVGHMGAGGVIGIASAIFGIGGGSLTVPYLCALRVRMQEAVATSSACGMPIALAGAAGYIATGWGNASLPAGTLGYVHLPSLLALVLTSVPMAAVGVRLAHRLPAQRLKQVFALLLLLVAADFLLM